MVIGGYQKGGRYSGCSVDIDTVYESVGALAAGTMTIDQLGELADEAIEGPGVAPVWQRRTPCTALAEALGMTVAGSAPTRANSASHAGQRQPPQAGVIVANGRGA